MEGGKVRYRWGKRWEGIELKLVEETGQRGIMYESGGIGAISRTFRLSLELVREEERQG